jgi:hypothetical protein
MMPEMQAEKKGRDMHGPSLGRKRPGNGKAVSIGGIADAAMQ